MKIVTGLILGTLAAVAGCGGSGMSSAVMPQAKVPSQVINPQVRISRSTVVAFIGDSITAGWYANLMPGVGLPNSPFTVLNVGIAGQGSAIMLARFQTDVIDAVPAVGTVVIDAGINDWLHNDGTPVTVDNIATMAHMATQAGIRVILASVMLEHYLGTPGLTDAPKEAIEAFDANLIALAQANGYLYADYKDVMLLSDGTEDFSLYLDGLHPNPAGYAKMWPVVFSLIQEDLQ